MFIMHGMGSSLCLSELWLYLTFNAPITTAADYKFCDIFPIFEKIKYDIS